MDFETGLIHFTKTKNGRERFVRISPILDSVLREHFASHNYAHLLVGIEGKRLNSHGELVRLMNKFREFFPMNKADWGSHSLRHSFAYNSLKKSGRMYQLQAILGHRSIDVTVDLYGQLQAQDIECPSPYEP
ncbi:MAG: site-specific integrase [Bacteriovorax sp.]|nr:site-specific integrase [Bacteriovorax sp.]